MVERVPAPAGPNGKRAQDGVISFQPLDSEGPGSLGPGTATVTFAASEVETKQRSAMQVALTAGVGRCVEEGRGD